MEPNVSTPRFQSGDWVMLDRRNPEVAIAQESEWSSRRESRILENFSLGHIAEIDFDQDGHWWYLVEGQHTGYWLPEDWLQPATPQTIDSAIINAVESVAQLIPNHASFEYGDTTFNLKIFPHSSMSHADQPDDPFFI